MVANGPAQDRQTYSQEGRPPIPDPTVLTTNAVRASEEKIRELYDLRFEQLDLRLEQRFQAQSKSLDAALISADLKSNALSDKITALGLDMKESLSRTEYDSAHKALLDKIDDLRARYYEQTGVAAGSNVNQQLRELSVQLAELKSSRDQSYGQAQAQPTTAAQIADLASEVRALRDYRATTTGKGVGANALYGYLIGGFSFLVSVVLFVLFITGHR